MSTFPSRSDKISVIATFGLVILAIALWWLSGCTEVRRPDITETTDPPTVAEQIRAIGERFLVWGGLVLGLGMVIRGVVWIASLGWITGPAGAAVAWIARILGPFVGLGAVAGGLSVAFGAACVWAADYLPVVICAGIAACVALAVYYWPRIRRWIPARSPSRT